MIPTISAQTLMELPPEFEAEEELSAGAPERSRLTCAATGISITAGLRVFGRKPP
jgi:hypothetical protein